MLRKLTQNDHERVFHFLMQEPSYNIFILGDIEAFGYETEFQELWGQFLEDGSLQAVLLRYYDSFIPYARSSFDVAAFAEKMKGYSGLTVSGKANIVEQFETVPQLVLGQKRKMYFCECTSLQDEEKIDDASQVQLATYADIGRIVALRRQITEFMITDNAEEMMQRAMEAKTGRTYYIEEQGEIIACASTAAETSWSAMVVGVCTHRDARGQGYASRILTKMITDVTEEGKSLCLFYDNPHAGRIYKRLGFRDLGLWTMYR